MCSLPVTIPHEVTSPCSSSSSALPDEDEAGKHPDWTNAEKCKYYRERDKKKRKDLDVELDILVQLNEKLKVKNEKLTKNVKMLKAAYLKMLAKKRLAKQKLRESKSLHSGTTQSSDADQRVHEPIVMVKSEVTEMNVDDIVVKHESIDI